MKPPQALGVAVRVVGLLAWLAALFYLISAAVVAVAPTYRPNISPWWHYVVSAIILFLVGWCLLRGADRIVAFAYRGDDYSRTDA